MRNFLATLLALLSLTASAAAQTTTYGNSGATSIANGTWNFATALPIFGLCTGYVFGNAASQVVCSATASATMANPTQAIDLSTHNGVATTAMRSDGAPPLSQAINPTWTATHTFAETIVSTKATGTPPFTIASTTLVPNLYVARAASADGMASTGFANPTQSIDLSTHNGVATTAMRSDASPPLSQAINPTWTALHTYTNSMLAMLGSSTGKTTFTSDNAGASNFTVHIPAANDTFAMLAASQALTNKDFTGAGNTFPTFNQNTTGSAAKWTTPRNLAGNSVDGSANVAFTNKVILQGTTDAGFSAAQFLGALGTCILKNTTTTGVLSCTTAGTDYLTSVGVSFTGGLISVGSSPLTANGTIALTVAGTSGGVPYFSSTSAWASSALLATNAIVLGGGAGNPPATTTTGTGVVAALGVNVGTAGAFVVNGGALGTPSSGTLSSATGLPISTGVSGLGTGIATALAVNTGLSGAPVLFNGAGGTPTSLDLTNATSYEQDGAGTTFTPTMTCASGTLTTASATGRYKLIGTKLYWAVWTVTITTVGTCSGLTVSLPASKTAGSNSMFVGADGGTGGEVIRAGLTSGSTATDQFVTYNVGNPLVNGAILKIAGVFEVQ